MIFITNSELKGQYWRELIDGIYDNVFRVK